MGSFAAEMCAPYCLPLVVNPSSDIETEWAYVLLKKLIKYLTPKAVKKMVLPAIQKILQASHQLYSLYLASIWTSLLTSYSSIHIFQTTGYSHLKVSLLQDSFVREIWKKIGKRAYLESVHPLVISNLHIAPHKTSASAAAVLLIGSSEELGVPITVYQV